MFSLLLLLALPAVVEAQFTYTITNGTITITGYTGYGGTVSIPSTINGLPVTSIAGGAFQNCCRLTSLTIPNGVTYIGAYAFAWCCSLASVTIPNSLTSLADHVFFSTALTSVTIPYSVTNIESCAFASCALISVTIPYSVTSIGSGAFGCTSLTTITVDPLNSVYSSVAGILFNKSQTTLLQCPGARVGNYTVPNSVTSIGDSAFGNCTSLTTVTIPDSVTNIGNEAFSGCTSLTSVAIPNSITSIETGAFSRCTSLASVTIPNSVTSIGEAAFGGSGLISVTIPNSVTYIGRFAFEACTGLASVTILDGVTRIDENAFNGCTSLTSITIPGSATTIGDDAFSSCTSLTNVTISSGTTNIGTYAFGGCNSLTAITVEGLNSFYSSLAGVLFNKSQTMLIQYPGGKAANYTIPNSVTSIGNWGFGACTGLTSVMIPNSVTNIGERAFSDCTSLTNVTIPNSVTNIGVGAFWSCTRLTSVTIPDSVTSIGGSAFNDCGSLTSLTIPDSVANLGSCAFWMCTALLGVYFEGNAPGGADSYTFYSDSYVTVYYLPGTTGWGATYGGRPTALWTQVPTIQTSPQTQTAEAGSAVGLWVHASSPLPLFYLWYLNSTNLLSCSTNCELELTNVQFAQSGAYTVVISNVLGAVTSAPARLNVIAPVERRPVPGLKLMGEAGSLLNVDYANSLSPAPNWTPLGSVSLTSTSQYYFDLTLPLPPQRFYRAWQTGTPGVMPSLDLHPVPAITLTGSIGDSVRVDYINRFGPTDAWVTLDTVALTNTSQLYFDVSAWGQPQRLYRLVQVP